MLPAVGSIKRRMVRPTVVLPHPDSPTRPTVSAGPTLKLTSSTACTKPMVRRSSPRRTGKYFLRPFTSSTAALSGIGGTHDLVGMPAGRPVLRGLLLVGWILLAAHVAGKGAARRETAAGRQIAEGGHNAGNFLQPLHGDPIPALVDAGQTRNGVEEAARIGVARPGKQGVHARLFHFATGVHDNDALGRFRHHAEVVGDEDHGGPELALQAADQ